MSEETRQTVNNTISYGLVKSTTLIEIRNAIEPAKIDSVEHEIASSDGSPVFASCTWTKDARKLLLLLLLLLSMLSTFAAGYSA